MMDRDLIAKKLTGIETFVQELRDLGRPADIQEDVRERRFVERTLQIAIQAMLDVAANLLPDELPDERAGESEANRGLIDYLERNGWLQADLAGQLRGWMSLRNTLIYDYESVDLDRVERIAIHHLDDFLAFVQAIRQQVMPS
jgi:uncharacterized protein YutE (UPF0331/DUF86 family)